VRSTSPAALGYRLPAEWERHEATWIGWPHNLSDWPVKFIPIPWVYAEIVRKIAPAEMLRILVNSNAHEEQAGRILRRVGVDLSNAAVLVPTFDDPHDRIALGTLAELFRDRPVIGIHAVDLVWGLATLHCLTHEQPATARAETGN
jgi:agmatine/peptidylarginine deiminase